MAGGIPGTDEKRPEPVAARGHVNGRGPQAQRSGREERSEGCRPLLPIPPGDYLREYKRATMAPLMLCQTLNTAPGMVAMG